THMKKLLALLVGVAFSLSALGLAAVDVAVAQDKKMEEKKDDTKKSDTGDKDKKKDSTKKKSSSKKKDSEKKDDMKKDDMKKDGAEVASPPRASALGGRPGPPAPGGGCPPGLHAPPEPKRAVAPLPPIASGAYPAPEPAHL